MVKPLLALLLLAIPAAAQSPLSIATTSLPSGAPGTPYSFVFTASGGTAPYTWTAAAPLPTSFTLSTTGTLNGAPGIDGAGTFSIQVMVADAASHSASKTFSLTIDPGYLIITPSVANGSVGVPYSQVIQASGGTPPYTFSFSGNSLFNPPTPPPGLTISAAGAMSGTPTQAGTFSFTVQVEDATNKIAYASYTITFGTALTFTSVSPLPSGVAGAPYSQIVFAAGGLPPYTFSLVGTPPAGLSISASGVLSGTPVNSGTTSVTVKVTDGLGVSATMQYSVTFSAAPALLQTSTQAISFSGAVEGDIPPSQSLAILSTSQTAVNYTLTVEGGTPAWLSLTPIQGSTPGRVTVTVNQGHSQDSVLNATIHVTVTGNNSAPSIDVSVRFAVVGISPQLEVVPNILSFAARSQAPGTFTQYLAVRNTGGSGAVPFTVSPPSQGSFISSVSPVSSSTAVNSPTLVQIQVNTAGLAVGHFRDHLQVKWFAGTVDIPVELFISDQGPVMDLGVKGFRFQTRQGQGGNSAPAVNVINRGDPASSLHWTATLLSGQDWLNLLSPNYTTSGSLNLAPAANLSSLPSGPRYALVQLTDPSAPASPQYFTAVLDNADSSTPATPMLNPGGLVFTAVVGSGKTSQVVQVNTSSAAAVAFQTSVSSSNGSAWLTASSGAGTASTSAPGALTISADPSGLPGGVYTGEVDVVIGTQWRTVSVTFIVTNVNIAQCAPTRLVVAPTGLTNGFSVPTGWPETLRVQVNDDCGNAVPNAAVTAAFSSGDFPLSFRTDGAASVYSATWAPGIAAPQVNITLRAIFGNLQGSAVTIGDAFQNNAPVLARHGVLNNANPLVGGAMAPGVVAQVFGSGLATNTTVTTGVPLPRTYIGSQLLVGSLSAPLYYVSSNQLTVQIPAELATNQQYSVVASVNGALTVPDTIDVAPVLPGVAAFSDGTLIAQHSDFSLVTTQNPAKRGEYLIMYLVGMGATSPAVGSGAYPPSVEPLARAVTQPTVTIDNQNAMVIYGGMTPFSIGLFQINFQVPVTAKTGTPLNVVVTQGTATANVTTLTVSQ